MNLDKSVGKDFERKDSELRGENYNISDGDVESIGFLDKYPDEEDQNNTQKLMI